MLTFYDVLPFVLSGVEVIYEIIKDPSLHGVGGNLKLYFGQSYDGKPFVSVAKEGLVLPDDEEHKKIFESEKIDHDQLCNFMKDSLKEKIEKVKWTYIWRSCLKKWILMYYYWDDVQILT